MLERKMGFGHRAPLTSLRVTVRLIHLVVAPTTIAAAGERCLYFLAGPPPSGRTEYRRPPVRPARARPPGRAQQAGRTGGQVRQQRNPATSAPPQAACSIPHRGGFGNDVGTRDAVMDDAALQDPRGAGWWRPMGLRPIHARVGTDHA
jgi:hypothetical protein